MSARADTLAPLEPRSRSRHWLLAALDLVFPAICPACDAALDVDRRDPLCGACWRAIPRIVSPWCDACGLPFLVLSDMASPPTGRCQVCVADAPPFTWARAAARYAPPVREALQALKFGKKRALARPLGDLLHEQLAAALPADVDALVPVPLAPAREEERGFNQSALLAERLARRLAVPVRPRWLVRTRATRAQTELTAAERHANVRDAFRASRDVHGRYVVVVDDVLTTGATVAECARALRREGARDVGVVTVARVV